MNTNSKILLAFAIGAAVGATAVYYLQTEEGEEALQNLKDATGKLKADVEANLAKGKDILNDITSTAQSLMNNIDN